MGVKGLWKILDDLQLGETKELGCFSGKRVAVDLSGWVVQALKAPGLNRSKNPHLRNLFFRVSRLLNHGIFPVFILEGHIPELKEAVFKDRNHHGSSRSDNITRSRFDGVLNQCSTFLESLGIPCIKSSGEAEALCAFLYANNIVDAIITEDGDTFLYGADTVLRDFSAEKQDPHVVEYSLKSPQNTLKLDQTKLIALALLLGCDYDNTGVPNIGTENAKSLLKEIDGFDLLQRFQDWNVKSESELFPGYDLTIKKQAHCIQCSHLGSINDHKLMGCSICNSQNTCFSSDGTNPCSCGWHKNQEINLKHKTELKVYRASRNLQNFPNMEIIEEFKNYQDCIPNDSKLEWNCPNLEAFQKHAFEHFYWTYEDSFKKAFPLITLWQQIKLINQTLSTEKTLYKPFKILKKRKKDGKGCFEVLWNKMDGCSELDNEDLCSIEIEERFKVAYPELSEDFLNKIQSDSKMKNKSPKPTKNKKMTEYYRATKHVKT